MIIKLKEKIQCGDNWLLKWNCPYCFKENLSGFPINDCSDCKTILKDFPINYKCSSRLLTGTLRKSKISKKIVRNLMEEQNGLCAYCNLNIRDVEYDVEHILPLSVGGTNNVYNLCLSCKKCNSVASSYAFSDFIAKKNYILKYRK